MPKIKQKTSKKQINKKHKLRMESNFYYQKRFSTIAAISLFCFIVLAFHLYQVMLRDQVKYEKRLEALSTKEVEGSTAPRGRILDRNGKVIVDNKAVKTIYYQKEKGRTALDEINLAYKVAPHLNLSISKLNDRMKREFFVAKNSEKMKKRIKASEYEKVKQRKLTQDDILELKIERVTDDELNSFTDEDKKAAYLYYLMNKGYTYDQKVIRTKDVTDEEYAYIAENNKSLDGFNTRLDWERSYPYGDVFRTILGTVSDNGIPSEEKAYYLKKGYSLDDRVGTSYLEKQYEDYLRGKKEVYKVLNRHELELVSDGKRGNDIVLTIDIELQKQVEEILKKEIVETKSQPNTQYYDRSFVVVQDPNTGEILAMAGKQVLPDGKGDYKIIDYTAGVVISPMTSGSVVKGASMIVAYNQGAIKIGEYQQDECIKLAGTKKKCSWKTLGRINDIDALALSSNVYQFKAAMKVAGYQYNYNMPFKVDKSIFDTYRNTFHEFGLGVATGIDLPVESRGTSSDNTAGGLLLDFVMGQYDTYTPMQLSQYVSTIANKGTRYQPHLLKEVHKSTDDESLGKVIYTFEPNVLNKVNTKEEYLNRVREGFHAVTTKSYGLGRNYIDASHDPSGKTGTSQSFTDSNGDGKIDTPTVSTAFIGYAPTDNPKMSITVTSPNSSLENSSINYSSMVTRRISKSVSDIYFNLYP